MLHESPATVRHCTRPTTSRRLLPRREKHGTLCCFTDCWERSVLATHMYILELIQNWLYLPNVLENTLLCTNLYCNSTVPPPLYFYYEIHVFPFLFIFCISTPIVWGCVKISKTMPYIFYFRHSLYIRCV